MPTTTPFGNLITFSRGSNATLTGANGLIQWAPNNLLTFSESFDAATWTKVNATVFANQDVATGAVGPELVVNGDFATDTNWTKGVGWTITGGVAVATAVASFEQIFQNIGVVSGRTYQVSVTATVTSGSFSAGLGNSGQGIWLTQTASGTYTTIITTSTLSSGNVYVRGNPTFTGTIDNISVREITVPAATAPDGSQTADTLVENTATGEHSALSNNITSPPAGTICTVSFYAKAGTRYKVGVTYPTVGDAGVAWDLSTGTQLGALAGSALSAAITPVGGGWYRCAMTFNRPTSANAGNNFHILADSATSISTRNYAGNGTGALLIWGAQLEFGSAATAYNPTSVKNLLGFSEAFDNAAWTKLNTSIVTGAQANPINGLFNAQKLMEDTANAQHIVQQGFSVLSGTPYVFSVYAKAAGRNRFSFRFGSIAPADNVTFDLSNGTIVTGSAGYVASIASVGSGWYRCSITSTPSSSGTRQHQIYLNSASGSGVETYTGDGNSGVYIYGAQLSDSASLDPYVPTPAAAPSSTAYYGPRFDFDPVTRQPRGLLIEEARTNLLLYSEQFDNASWTKNEIAATANAGVAPDGATTADRLTPNAGLVTPFVFQAATTTASAFTVSFYAKADGYSFVQLSDGVSVTDYCNFDLSTGGVGASIGYTGSIVNAGNGWYRCVATKTFTAASTEIRVEPLATNLASRRPNYTANGTSGILIWGAQLEAGAFATSYIPTVASTVTRSADLATVSGSLFSQWYRQAEGTLVAEFSGPSGGYSLNMTDGTTNNATGIVYLGATTLRGISVVSGAGRFVDMAANATPAINKTSYGYRLNDLGGSTNGGAVVTNATAPVPVLDRLFVGTFSSFSFLNGHIRSIRFIPARAADFQLQALSALPIVDYFFLQTATGDQLVDGNGDDLYSQPIFG